jgi:hypothetical protein
LSEIECHYSSLTGIRRGGRGETRTRREEGRTKDEGRTAKEREREGWKEGEGREKERVREGGLPFLNPQNRRDCLDE